MGLALGAMMTVRIILTSTGHDFEQHVATGTTLRSWSDALGIGEATHVSANGKTEAGDYILQDGDELSLSVKGTRNWAEVFADGSLWPEVMLPEEVCQALRLDELHGGDMEKALRALARLTDDKKVIRATVYAGPGGGKRVYTIEAVREFIRQRFPFP